MDGLKSQVSLYIRYIVKNSAFPFKDTLTYMLANIEVNSLFVTIMAPKENQYLNQFENLIQKAVVFVCYRCLV